MRLILIFKNNRLDIQYEQCAVSATEKELCIQSPLLKNHAISFSANHLPDGMSPAEAAEKMYISYSNGDQDYYLNLINYYPDSNEIVPFD